MFHLICSLVTLPSACGLRDCRNHPKNFGSSEQYQSLVCLEQNLVLNESKSNLMVFALVHCEIETETQESARFLSVTLDSTLR